jgi:hypothetical protein
MHDTKRTLSPLNLRNRPPRCNTESVSRLSFAHCVLQSTKESWTQKVAFSKVVLDTEAKGLEHGVDSLMSDEGLLVPVLILVVVVVIAAVMAVQGGNSSWARFLLGAIPPPLNSQNLAPT